MFGFTSRPTYLWTFFLAIQGLIFGLCALFQVEGAPPDAWLLALVHIPLCMVFGAMESWVADKPMHDIRDTDEYAHLFSDFNPLDQQPH